MDTLLVRKGVRKGCIPAGLPPSPLHPSLAPQPPHVLSLAEAQPTVVSPSRRAGPHLPAGGRGSKSLLYLSTDSGILTVWLVWAPASVPRVRPCTKPCSSVRRSQPRGETSQKSRDGPWRVSQLSPKETKPSQEGDGLSPTGGSLKMCLECLPQLRPELVSLQRLSGKSRSP